MSTEKSRFWAKVAVGQPDECWAWLASHEKDSGYGVFYLRAGKKSRAHRYALALRLERPLAAGKLACHSCNNPGCVNPWHLYEGDHASNSRDKVDADRQVRGSAHPSSHLSEAQVVEIVTRYHATRISQAALAAEFGVHQSEISRMVRGKSWRHVTADLSERITTGKPLASHSFPVAGSAA